MVLEDIGERVRTLKIERSRESNSELLHKHTNKGHHGNTPILNFDGTTTGEAFFVLDKTKRVEQVKRTWVDTKTIGRPSIRQSGSGGRNLTGIA